MDYKAYGFFTYSGFGTSGLNVTCDIFNGSGSVSTNLIALDIGGGLYSCTYSTNIDDDYLFIFKTISSNVDQNQIAALYTNKTEIPFNVWNYANRTLSTFGTLIYDIWNYSIRTLTASVYNGGNNMSTNLNPLIFYTNATNQFTVSNVPDDPEVWFTMKSTADLGDESSTVQISRTGGLLYANGQEISGSSGPLFNYDGSINVTSGCVASIFISASAAPLLFGSLSNDFTGEIKTRSSASIVTVVTQFPIETKVALTKRIK